MKSADTQPAGLLQNFTEKNFILSRFGFIFKNLLFFQKTCYRRKLFKLEP